MIHALVRKTYENNIKCVITLVFLWNSFGIVITIDTPEFIFRHQLGLLILRFALFIMFLGAVGRGGEKTALRSFARQVDVYYLRY